MNKLFLKLTTFLLFICISIIVILSSIGIQTDKFNKLISNKINQANKNTTLTVETIKFKINLKELSLFLETENPKIIYRKTEIPAKNIKVYIDFISLLKSKPKIEKIRLVLFQVNFNQFKEISSTFKPSNFTSFVNNKIISGKIDTEIDFFFNNENKLDDFIARGKITNLKAEIVENFILQNTDFNYLADKTDIIIKNISSEVYPFKFYEGDIKINLSKESIVQTNFKSKINFKSTEFKDTDIFKNIEYLNTFKDFNASLNNNLSITFDDTYKVKEFNYKNSGKISEASIVINDLLPSEFHHKSIDKLFLSNSNIETNIEKGKSVINLNGDYSFDNKNYMKFNLENSLKEKFINLKINAKSNREINLEMINYKTSNNNISDISIDLQKNNENIKIHKLSLLDGDNTVLVKDLRFKKGKFQSFKKIEVKTSKNGKINNNFKVDFAEKIFVKGTSYDATNLPKILSKKTNNKIFSTINAEIDIDFKNILVPLSESLESFKLLGKIENGKFVKVSSKGDFGNNKFLDITMKNDKNKRKKYLEVYSDLPKPLLSEFNFFKGLNGGKLLYSVIIEEQYSNSKLIIEDFKVVNAPGMIKLLSLADLGGLADLAQGAGLTFDILKIKMEKRNDNLKIDEILALGPSVSILMEGYQNKDITSLRGTLVPAKTLNKLISKIPLIGDIVIPKEVGEGLFGVSFKMKGPPGKIKTTINPIRTITPRFIQKIIDKNKKKSK